MTTGEKIRLARKNKGLTQAQLAKALGVPFQSISQWERDQRKPKYDSIKKIANAIGVPWYELVPEEEQAKIVVDGLYTKLQKNKNWIEFIDEYKKRGYEFTNEEKTAVNCFNKLNSEGRQISIAVMSTLAKDNKYIIGSEKTDV